MKSKLITYVVALITVISSGTTYSAEKGKGTTSSETKAAPKAKRDTYPLYAKVTAITSRTLTVVRSDKEDAKESKYTINSATQIVNGDKPATVEDVKVGRWVSGSLKKAEADGNDVVIKLNVGAKQKEAGSKGTKKGEAKASK